MQQEIKEKLNELIEALLEDVLILDGTPHRGVPNDPNPVIIKLRDEIIAMYKHPIGRTGWVKATDRLPGYEKPVKWRDGNDHTHVTDGKIPLINMAKPFLIGWEWYDESPNEQPVEKKENEAVSISLMKEKHEAEIALYETRISLYRLMKAFEKENKTSSQQKYYDQADSILNKHFSVKDVLR